MSIVEAFTNSTILPEGLSCTHPQGNVNFAVITLKGDEQRFSACEDFPIRIGEQKSLYSSVNKAIIFIRSSFIKYFSPEEQEKVLGTIIRTLTQYSGMREYTFNLEDLTPQELEIITQLSIKIHSSIR